jgi:DNA mismatch repair protein MutL
MTEIIRLLPDHIANQIAAGEVIQRPASVVKELVENAIDAGATKIEVFIKNAGKTLIQVIDNGCGMSEIDARMSFERHATSKIQSADELFSLQTKGFRGEALASIAAISHVKLKTKLTGRDFGTSITVEGSKVVEQVPETSSNGSSFEVKNLFFNVPARRNFLKSEAVEFRHIEDEFIRIALAHSSLSFKLVHNENVCYQLSEANLRKRIVDVFGKNYNDRLVPIEETTGIVSLNGFIGKPEFAKKTRGEQFLFVNNRFFKDSYFNHAVNSAFEGMLPQKTFPSYFLYFYVDPSTIDVNVHPTKTEIKFENERDIYVILKSAVRQSLGKFNIVPTLDFEREKSFDIPISMNSQPAFQPEIKVNSDYNPFKTFSKPASSGGYSSNSEAMKKVGFGKELKEEDWSNFYKIDEISEEKNQKLIDEESFESSTKQFIFNTKFLFCTIKSGILAIHIRRAKERIVYDEMMKTFLTQPIHSQQLMFPIDIELSEGEKMLWLENRKTIERAGFMWEENQTGLSINGAPSYLEDTAIQNAITHINDNLSLGNIDKGEVAHEIICAISSSASFQNLQWNNDSANQFLEQLFQCQDHQYSPKGKKIINTISEEEITQKF